MVCPCRKRSNEPIKKKKESYQQWKTQKTLKPHLEFRGRGIFHPLSPGCPTTETATKTRRRSESRGPSKKGRGQKASSSPEIRPQVPASRATQGRPPAGTQSLLPSCPSRVLPAAEEKPGGPAAPPPGLPQRPPSSRRRSGRATAPSRRHHLILRGCRALPHLPAGTS